MISDDDEAVTEQIVALTEKLKTNKNDFNLYKELIEMHRG